jgi:hypothetical protein
LYFLASSVYTFFISITSNSKDDWKFFWGSIALFFVALFWGDKLVALIWQDWFNVIAQCIFVILAGAAGDKLVRSEWNNYYMSDNIHKITKWYPTAFYVCGAVGLVLELLPKFIDLTAYASLFSVLSGMLTFLLVGGVALYMVRTIHLFIKNK